MVISLLRLRVFFLNFCYTVVINILPGTLHFLTEPGIFCCGLVLGTLDSEKGWLLIHVQKCLNHQVHAFIDEALSELLKLDETTSCLVKHLDVLSSGKLELFLDTFLLEVLANFVSVNVRVILADLADEGLCRVFGS